MEENKYRLNTGSFFLAFILFLLSVNIFAQVEIPDSVVTERLQLIEKMLDEGKSGANCWWYGWLAGYSAATVGQGVACFISNDKGTRQDMALGAMTTLLGAAGQLLTPMSPGYASDRLAAIPEDSREARLKKLNNAEELLKSSAQREKTGRSWQAHAVASIVNAGSGLVTWFVFRRDVWAGVKNFAFNTVITEAQIWTQPTRAMKDYRNYCNKHQPGANPVVLKNSLSWTVGASPGGIDIKIVF